MEQRYSNCVVAVLRDTLRKLEQSSGILQKDPAMTQIKRQIIRTIAELRIAKETAANRM